MSRRASLAWWLSLGVALPVLLPLAWYTRRTALRLPEANGPQQEIAGGAQSGTPMRLLLLGESTVAGVGVERQQQALSGQLGCALAEHLACPVHWQALGVNGITAVEACEQLLPKAPDSLDQVVLVFGVNDTTHFSSRRAWRRAMTQLANGLSARGAQVAVTAVPPIEHFSALPWLLRRMLGWRARLLDADLRQLAAELGHLYCELDLRFAPAYLAEDGYHPSAQGYAVWAQALAQRLAEARESGQTCRMNSRTSLLPK